MTATIEYVADLMASVALIIAGRGHWPTWWIGVGALVLTIAAKNLSTWRQSPE